MHAEIKTAKGTMHVILYEKEVPGTVANFVKLGNRDFETSRLRDFKTSRFVIQGGWSYSRTLGDPYPSTTALRRSPSPNIGEESGGPGWSIKCETSAPLQHHDRGVLSMAHAGKDTGGSQFFICHNRQNTQHLDGVHSCFGAREARGTGV